MLIAGGRSLALLLVVFNLGCTSLLYYPSKRNFPPPSHIKTPPFRDIFFNTSDGVRLHGRFFFSQKPAKGTIVQFHGNAENLTTHYASLIWLVEHGYHLFTFDYRGYGQSESTPSPEGLRLDALSALKKARQFHRQYSPAQDSLFVVIGQSLGGAVALKGVEEFPQNSDIHLVVLDSSFASYQEIGFKKLSASWQTWAFSPLAYILLSDKTSAHLGSFTHPLLIIHSQKDPIVPFSCSETIYEKATSLVKVFWKGEEAGHILGLSTPSRQKKFLKFLGRQKNYQKQPQSSFFHKTLN